MSAFTINFQDCLLLLTILIVNVTLIYGLPVPQEDKNGQNSPNYNCLTGECIRLANKGCSSLQNIYTFNNMLSLP